MMNVNNVVIFGYLCGKRMLSIKENNGRRDKDGVDWVDARDSCAVWTGN